MLERYARGWEIASSSLKVLKKDKHLVLFPIFSGIACTLVMASFIVPLIASPDLLKQVQAAIVQDQSVIAIACLGFYIINYFIIIFFNSALITCALIRYAGGEPTIHDGVSAAWSRLPQILAWAVVAGTVGWIIRTLEERAQILGRIAMAFLGAAWTAATFFVVPVIIVEKCKPFDALKRSTSILRQTWGETVAAKTSMGLVTFVLMIPAMAMIWMAFETLGGQQQPGPLPILLFATAILWSLAAAAIGSALQGVFVAALYIYSTRGIVPVAFEANTLERAFAGKPGLAAA